MNLDKLERLFRAAQMHPPSERLDFVDAACEGDQELRKELLSLLEAHEKADDGSFLDSPIIDDPSAVPEQSDVTASDFDRHNEVVGPYTIIRSLGRGGMGDVYLASQELPFKRQVALKIIRRGMDTEDVVRRFEMERQILAALDHPNIGRLLDGGLTNDQLPYFALEYIDGLPITEYCDKNRLTIRERVKLFQVVCQAVHYAHQNLIIHRDLKPTNILVTPDRQVKLLDFGIAKLLNPSLSSVAAPLTRNEKRPMTPEYASPEQIAGETLSTSSDVYSLGVILYELLTGSRPLELRNKSANDVQKLVQEVDPEKPSTLVTRADRPTEAIETRSTTLSIGESRDTPIEKIVRQLRGDLDNIVMMALRKEPSRRYRSSEQLAQDLDNYLNDLPVVAHSDSQSYRISKFLKRHRIEAVAISCAIVMLLGFSIVSAMQSARIAVERDRAQIEATKSQQITDFVLSLFEHADPTISGDSVLVKSVLEKGAERVRADLSGQPEVQGEMLRIIGQAYSGLGNASRAVELYSASVEAHRTSGNRSSVEYAASLFRLAVGYEQSLRLDESKVALQEYLILASELYGSESAAVLSGMYHLGYIEHVRGNAAEADSIFSELAKLQDQIELTEDPDLAASLVSMAQISLIQNDLAQAERYARDALTIERRLFSGTPSASLSHALTTLAWVHNASNNFSQAEQVAREALSINRQLFPEGHRELSHNLSMLAEALMGLQRYSESRVLFEEALELSIHLVGNRHPSVARAHNQLGRLLRRTGDYAEAIDHYGHAINIYQSMFGEDYVIALRMIQDQAYCYRLSGDFAQAESLYLHSYNRLRETKGPEASATQQNIRQLIALYEEWGRAEDASTYQSLLTD